MKVFSLWECQKMISHGPKLLGAYFKPYFDWKIDGQRPTTTTDDDGPTAAAARMMLHAWKLRVPLPEGRRLVARSRDPFPIRGGRLRPRVDPGLGRARIV